MANKLYEVSYSWYEEYCPTLLEGPEQKDWNKYCRKIIPLAIRNLFEYRKHSDRKWSWIGYHDIIEEIINILTKTNYRIVKPETFNLCGSNIIDNKEEAELLPPKCRSDVVNYNQIMRTVLNITRSINSNYRYGTKGFSYVISYKDKTGESKKWCLAGIFFANSKENALKKLMRTSWGKILSKDNHCAYRIKLNSTYRDIIKLIK